MKKYTTPELNVTKFDVEDVITTSVAAPSWNGYTEADVNYVADPVQYNEIFGE